jgi:hypothetical protein
VKFSAQKPAQRSPGAATRNLRIAQDLGGLWLVAGACNYCNYLSTPAELPFEVQVTTDVSPFLSELDNLG